MSNDCNLCAPEPTIETKIQQRRGSDAFDPDEKYAFHTRPFDSDEAMRSTALESSVRESRDIGLITFLRFSAQERGGEIGPFKGITGHMSEQIGYTREGKQLI